MALASLLAPEWPAFTCVHPVLVACTVRHGPAEAAVKGAGNAQAGAGAPRRSGCEAGGSKAAGPQPAGWGGQSHARVGTRGLGGGLSGPRPCPWEGLKDLHFLVSKGDSRCLGRTRYCSTCLSRVSKGGVSDTAWRAPFSVCTGLLRDECGIQPGATSVPARSIRCGINLHPTHADLDNAPRVRSSGPRHSCQC